MISKSRWRTHILLSLLTATFALCGCTPTQESETLTGLQTALTDFTQNRSLTEQFVRDIKSSTDPGDPAYLQAMESYQDARDVYNRYLDALESGKREGTSRSLRSATPLAVQNATADFLADATRALKPSLTTRRVAFQRAIVLPENLPTTLARMPKKARNELIDQFDDQIRWRSWGQL